MSTLGSRERILEVAKGELGSKDAEGYWADVLPGATTYPEGMWCGAFVLWVLREAGVTDRTWKLGSGFLLSGQGGSQKNFPLTKTPQPGDVAYFDQPFQHHAIVERVEGDRVHLIAGNTPTRDVARQTKPVRDAKFFSVAPFVVPNQELDLPWVGIAAAVAGVSLAAYIYFRK